MKGPKCTTQTQEEIQASASPPGNPPSHEPDVASNMAMAHCGVPNKVSAATLATEISLVGSKQCTLKRYRTMDALEAGKKIKPTTFKTSTCKVPLAHENP
jgi:hypothetical protein